MKLSTIRVILFSVFIVINVAEHGGAQGELINYVKNVEVMMLLHQNQSMR